MFEVGQVYRRKEDIHKVYGGQSQGGISAPRAHPIVLLFTGDSGAKYGYQDRFLPDGTFLYTGEGRTGDMQMRAGNLAIRDHKKQNKTLHLFEYIAKGKVRYLGEATYIGHHMEERPDINGAPRQAIVFELDVEVTKDGNSLEDIESETKVSRLWSRPLEEVRKLARSHTEKQAPPRARRTSVYVRSEAVKIYVLRRAAGHCESCGAKAPFKTAQGRPYLEPHHILRIADGGPDHPRYVAAICPNCHREAHFGMNREALNARLLAELAGKEPV